jgi:hypothetical protein
MPDYQTARRGVQQSEDLLEAANVAPTARTIIETFEVWHSSLAEPIYLAANPDAGSAVTCLAAPIVFSPPEENDEASAPETSLTFPNISDLVSQALRDARGSLDPWIITERVYASDDPSGPAQLPPLSLLIEAFTITGTEVTMVLGYGDPADVSVPVLKFRRNEYPTLQP